MIYKTYYSDELLHYGVKGMKWGVRKADRAEGRLTNRYKSTEKSGLKSKNRFLGRKMFADKNERTARGRDLKNEGQTELKAIGRTIGRDIVGQLVGVSAQGVTLGLTSVAAISGSAPLVIGGYAVSSLIAAGTGAYRVSSVIRGIQDVRDISNYKDSK